MTFPAHEHPAPQPTPGPGTARCPAAGTSLTRKLLTHTQLWRCWLGIHFAAKGKFGTRRSTPRATTFWKDPSLSFVQKVPVGHSGSTAPSQTWWRKREFGKGEQRPEIEFGTHRKTEAFGNTKGHSFISMQNYTLLFEEVDEIGAAGSPPTTSPDAH